MTGAATSDSAPPIRVLIFCLTVNFFGTERHAVELANALAEAHTVAILVRARPPEADKQLGYDTLLGAISPRVRVFTSSRKLPLLGLLRAMVEFRPDIIHAHNERAARWAKRLPFGPPVIATNHCGYRSDYDGCDGLICLTPAQVAGLPPGWTGQVFQIGNWVLPHPARDRAAARRSLGLAPDDFVVGSIGRLDPVKGVPALVDVFLATDLAGAKLVIIGTGDMEPALRARAADSGGRVVIAGFRADARDLYPAFDLFVLNSNVEPFGLVILEALDAGLPVVATATDGARAIRDGAPLHLVPIGDRAALIAALRAGREGRIAASPGGADAFRIGGVLQRIEQAYRELIARRQGSVSYASAMPSTTQTNSHSG
jgi:glycosyltransferase involved in cell wall biosynthesis